MCVCVCVCVCVYVCVCGVFSNLLICTNMWISFFISTTYQTSWVI